MTPERSTIRLTAAAFCAALALTAWSARADTDRAPASPALQQAQKLAELPPVHEPAGKHPPIDHSGRKQRGKASFYGHEFAGKKMANGNRFNPQASIAASKSLPLGTVAKVTNLKNGKSALVHVEDRGPYVKGRVVDVTPKVAKKLEMTKEGVAPVEIAPVALPLPDGGVKAGAGAAEVPKETAEQAIRQARAAAPNTQEASR